MSERKALEVKTPFGMLCAEIGGDTENYPEIFVYLRRDDGIEIDLTCVGTKAGSNKLNAYLYGDTGTDEWTKKHSWTKEELEIEID